MVDKNGNIVEESNNNIHLSDLLDSTYPLLQKFRESCPGTYKHSQAVSSMIEGVSIALDLDINFMKTIAMYHDIGKMYNPGYFTENQMDDENPHDKLDAWMSFQIISRHVSDGVNILLNDGNFPVDVIKTISRHHGNSVMQFFFNKSKSDDDASYRYKGEKPNSIVDAVLMIVDNVEAITRSIDEGKKINAKEIVSNVIETLMDNGELDSVFIKLGDLKKIREVLVEEVKSTYQKRVSYEDAEEIKE